jgi:hypothetical protein
MRCLFWHVFTSDVGRGLVVGGMPASLVESKDVSEEMDGNEGDSSLVGGSADACKRRRIWRRMGNCTR